MSGTGGQHNKDPDDPLHRKVYQQPVSSDITTLRVIAANCDDEGRYVRGSARACGNAVGGFVCI